MMSRRFWNLERPEPQAEDLEEFIATMATQYMARRGIDIESEMKDSVSYRDSVSSMSTAAIYDRM